MISHKIRISLLLGTVLILLSAEMGAAQQKAPEYVREAVNKIKSVLTDNSGDVIDTFIEKDIAHSETLDIGALRERLQKMRAIVEGKWENIEIRPDPEGIKLLIGEVEKTGHIKVIMDKKGIYNLYLVEPPDPITFSKANVDSIFRQLEHKGFAGLAYFHIDGKILYNKGFGLASKARNVPNTTETIFGIGSRPIDFTKAAIHLLEQRGQIRQDNTIDKYFDNVPSDKRSMTIRHLMTGRSGLPDFFHTSQDWDPDLAWIDRKTAERRILSQQLLFEPGTDQQHSHAAFVLLAALVERVADQSYFDFLDQNIFQPAGMNHTNEYGKAGDHKLGDFAVGYGSQSVGLPNIPPNWGPTSWLIKGSGGMYSTLDDLLTFYQYLRSGEVLEPEHREPFEKSYVTLDGSVRGFELFNIYLANGNEAYIFLNNPKDRQQMRELFRAATDFVKQKE